MLEPAGEGAWGGIAAHWYERAGASLDNPPGAGTLARAWLGPAAIRYVAALDLNRNAELRQKPWGACVEVRAKLPAQAENYAIARALAGWILSHHEPPESTAEAFDRRLAAVLLVPKPALVTYRATYGGSIEALAEAFVVPQALMALRLGECFQVPTALVWPNGRVERRGPTAALPADAQLRRMAKHNGVTPPLRRITLTDTPEIVAVQGDGCSECARDPL